MISGAYKKLLSANVISSAGSLLTVLILFKAMGKEMFGIFVFAQSIGLFSAAIANGQTWQSIVIFFSRTNIAKSECFKFSSTIDLLFSTFAFALVLVFIKTQVENQEQFNSNIILFYTFALLSFASQTGSALGVMQFYNQYSTLSVLKITISLLRLFSATLFLFYQAAMIYMATIWIASELFSTVIIWLSALKLLKKHKTNSAKTSENYKRDYSLSTLKGWGISLIDLPVQHADRLIIGSMLSPSTLAEYSIIKRITSNLAVLVDPNYQILLPFYSAAINEKRWTDIAKISRETSHRSLMIMLAASTSVLGGCYIFDDILFSGTIKKQLEIFLIFLSSGLFIAWYSYIHPLCYARQQFKLIFISTLVSNSLLLLSLFHFSSMDNLLGIATVVAIQPLLIGSWKSIYSKNPKH